MATPSLTASTHTSHADPTPRLDKKPSLVTVIIFFAVLAMGLLFTAYSLMHDMHEMGAQLTTWTPFLLLGVALLIALGFEFGQPPDHFTLQLFHPGERDIEKIAGAAGRIGNGFLWLGTQTFHHAFNERTRCKVLSCPTLGIFCIFL